MNTYKPQVYVASLETGKGGWLDVDGDSEDLLESIANLLGNDAEWEIQDGEDFGSLRVGRLSLEDLCEAANAIREYGDAFLAAMECECHVENGIEAAKERYCGAWDKLEDWAADFADQTGMLHEVPENLQYYFDFASWARDCELGGDIYSVRLNGQLHVFNSN